MLAFYFQFNNSFNETSIVLENIKSKEGFNYGEAQVAESPKDFIPKMEVVFIELKECRTALSNPKEE